VRVGEIIPKRGFGERTEAGRICRLEILESIIMLGGRGFEDVDLVLDMRDIPVFCRVLCMRSGCCCCCMKKTMCVYSMLFEACPLCGYTYL
jgi:hypothetical protein